MKLVYATEFLYTRKLYSNSFTFYSVVVFDNLYKILPYSTLVLTL
jgi:hypothetical protein